MIKGSFPVAVLIAALLVNAVGQQPQSPPPQQSPAAPGSRPQEEDEVVRITTNLVQVDAVVTDRDDKQVTDLGADDFEILENGRPQQITNFSYINAASPAASAPTRSGSKCSPRAAASYSKGRAA